MARGWESKSVEDQVAAAEAAKEAQAKPHLSAAEREALERKRLSSAVESTGSRATYLGDERELSEATRAGAQAFG
jgi:hypothetical protein